MATGGERRVTVTAESHDHDDDKDVKLQDQMQQLTAQLDQLRMDLRRVNESNRELAEKNKELQVRTRSKIISDSVVAPKPFLGKTAEQDPVDWLLWFEKYRGLQEDVGRRRAGVICHVDAGSSCGLDERAISGQREGTVI
jgi:hypothetical protein